MSSPRNRLTKLRSIISTFTAADKPGAIQGKLNRLQAFYYQQNLSWLNRYTAQDFSIPRDPKE